MFKWSDLILILVLTIIALCLIMLPACTVGNTPDEFSLHGFYGQSQGDGTASTHNRYPWALDGTDSSTSDSDFWMAGGTLTWYIAQPEPPLQRLRNAYGHPLR